MVTRNFTHIYELLEVLVQFVRSSRRLLLSAMSFDLRFTSSCLCCSGFSRSALLVVDAGDHERILVVICVFWMQSKEVLDGDQRQLGVFVTTKRNQIKLFFVASRRMAH